MGRQGSQSIEHCPVMTSSPTNHHKHIILIFLWLIIALLYLIVGVEASAWATAMNRNRLKPLLLRAAAILL